MEQAGTPEPAEGWFADASPDAVQRRRLTVLFCDIVGSTELSTKLDPEDLQRAMNESLETFSTIIDEAGGYVARYSGDGVLAYFGYPVGHEDDAARAIRAALRICEDRFALPAPAGMPLAVRFGIATGLVVVGESIGRGSARERTVVGAAPNLAARLQSFAKPNTVLVSEATHDATAGMFRFRSLGTPDLKGFSHAGQVWEVIEYHHAVERSYRREGGGPMPLLGRAEELGRICEGWNDVIGGAGRFIAIGGEAGIGKSRLVDEARSVISRAPVVLVRAAGTQAFSNSALHVVSQMIRRRLAGAAGLGPAEQLSRLDALLRQAGVDRPDALVLVADLIGIGSPELLESLNANAEQRRSDLFLVLKEWLFKTARLWPTALIVEDLHWVDPSSLEFLRQVVADLPALPLLLLITSRRLGILEAPPSVKHDSIVLTPLDGEICMQLVARASGHRLSESASNTIAARAGGIPLFARELALMALQRLPDAAAEVPETLSDLLLAKLDELGPAKLFVRMASVIGNEFHAPLLRAIAGLSQADLEGLLAFLMRADIVYAKAAGDTNSQYRFRHALMRDAAYDTMPRNLRRSLHGKAAVAIREDFPGTAHARPEILAYHWSQAQEWEQAFVSWRGAARQAVANCAYSEAQFSYERALEMIGDLPESTALDEAELELRSEHADVLRVTCGYSAPKTKAAVNAARRLAERTGDLQKRCDHLAGMWMAASSGGDYPAATALARQLIPLALTGGNAATIGVAYALQMTARHRTGDLHGAESTFETARSVFDSSEFHKRPGAPGQTFGNAAINAWLIGRVEESQARIVLGLDIARACESPYELAFATFMAAVQALLADDTDRASHLAEQSMRLSDERNFPQFAAISRVALGKAATLQGNPSGGLAMMIDGLRMMEANRSRNGMTLYAAWLAQVHCDLGNPQSALDVLDGALRSCPHERFFLPECLRIRSLAYRALGEGEKAGSDGRHAMAVARAIGAATLYRRARITLAAGA